MRKLTEAKKTSQKIVIDIAPALIWKILAALLLVWLIILVKDILLIFFLALIIVSAAQPLVDKLEEKRIPRPLGTLAIFATFLGAFSLIIFFIMPVLVFETKQLGENAKTFLENTSSFLENATQIAANYRFEANFQQLIENLSLRLGESASGIFSNTLNFLAGLLKILVVFSLSFYMLAKKDGIKKFLQSILPQKHQPYVIDLTERIQFKMGRWLIGQASLIILIFLLDYLVLLLLNVPFALILALLGGFLEIIPYLGPTLAFIPAVLVAFSVSPFTALLVAIGYIAIQQTENYLITPLVMKKAVGLNPVVIILSLLIGAKLAGVLGVILAVPTATAVGVYLKDVFNNKAFKTNG